MIFYHLQSFDIRHTSYSIFILIISFFPKQNSMLSPSFSPSLSCLYGRCLSLRRVRLQLLLQVVTSSQTFSHFFRQVKGRWHVTQVFVGKFSFLTPLIIQYCLELYRVYVCDFYYAYIDLYWGWSSHTELLTHFLQYLRTAEVTM